MYLKVNTRVGLNVYITERTIIYSSVLMWITVLLKFETITTLLIDYVVVQSLSHVWLCNPMDCDSSVFDYPPEFAQIHVYWVSDAIEPSHPLQPLLLPPSVFPSIRVFSNESALYIRWQKYWSFSIYQSFPWIFRVMSFIQVMSRIDWFDLLPVQGTLKSLLKHYS